MMDSTDTAAMSENASNTDCGGVWKIPRNCNPDNHTCEYSAKWELIPATDTIRFTITTKHMDAWTGIGFSDDERMVNIMYLLILIWIFRIFLHFFLLSNLFVFESTSFSSISTFSNVDKSLFMIVCVFVVLQMYEFYA